MRREFARWNIFGGWFREIEYNDVTMDTVDVKDAPASPRPRLPAKAIVGLVALAVLTILVIWRARVLELRLESQGEEPALVDKQAPEFSATTLDGQKVSLSDFRGQKNVVVSFWASWCGPCRLEMPVLTRFYRNNHTANSDFEILAVSIDEDTKDAMDYATQEKLNFPVILDSRGKMATDFEVEGIPTMFVIDKNGKIAYGHVGYDMGVEYRLANALGIKLKMAPEGAADGDSSH